MLITLPTSQPGAARRNICRVGGDSMSIENGRPVPPGSPADRWQPSAGRGRELPSTITFILRLAAILVMTIVPVGASDFATTGAEVNTRTLFHRVAVFSDASDSIHDPRPSAAPNWRRQNVRTYRTRLDQSPSARPRHRAKVRSSIWERPSLFRHATP